MKANGEQRRRALELLDEAEQIINDLSVVVRESKSALQAGVDLFEENAKQHNQGTNG